MPDIFSIKTMLRHYSLLPTVGLTAFAVALCGSYVTYMCLKKPDVSFRLANKDQLPEWRVGPVENVKMVKLRPLRYNPEIEELKREIASHYGW